MPLKKITLNNFRNYDSLVLDLPENGAVFEGDNGSGKTNILESFHLLCTGRSQRNALRGNLICDGKSHFFIEGEFVYHDESRQIISYGASKDGKLSLLRNGVQSKSFNDWFQGRPIVSFSGEDLQIVYGAPEYRRKIIDMLISQIYPEYLEALMQYKGYLHRRNRMLSQNSGGRLKNEEIVQIEIYETQLAKHGMILYKLRNEFVGELESWFQAYYEKISQGRERAKILYQPSSIGHTSSIYEWENVFSITLGERRNLDAERGFTSCGPHRDDYRLMLDDKPARQFGSQGQCRSLALSLKLAAVACIEKVQSGSMILLVDDACAELDTMRTSNLYSLIQEKGQVFIAVPQLTVPMEKSLPKFTVTRGKIYPHE